MTTILASGPSRCSAESFSVCPFLQTCLPETCTHVPLLRIHPLALNLLFPEPFCPAPRCPPKNCNLCLPVLQTATVHTCSPIASCNTLICLQLAMHEASSCGTHRVVTHSQKTGFSAHGTSCVASPILCSSKEGCSEE